MPMTVVWRSMPIGGREICRKWRNIGCEGMELIVEAWAEWAFESHDSSGWVFDSFGEIVHVTRPVIEVFADAAAG